MVRNVTEKIIVGAALTVAASVLLPIAKNTFPVLMKMGRDGASQLANRTKSSLQLAREEMEDIIAEAQFDRMRKRLDKEMGWLEEGKGRA
ncbi:DUF5132 domain-containing protein [Ammoniphilus sp. 3BR4]|uniref:DUF5132 domain-containing protein n=1 Tax=Ammoniphilus sp. 3BR4 TaxID=3158265 RepID=UPI003467CB85